MDPDGATLIVMVAVIVLAQAHLIETTALGWLAAATRTGIVASSAADTTATLPATAVESDARPAHCVREGRR